MLRCTRFGETARARSERQKIGLSVTTATVIPTNHATAANATATRSKPRPPAGHRGGDEREHDRSRREAARTICDRDGGQCDRCRREQAGDCFARAVIGLVLVERVRQRPRTTLAAVGRSARSYVRAPEP